MVRETAEGSGELALAGQPGVERDPAVADEQDEGVGETGVGGERSKVPDQSGYRWRR